VIFKKDKDKLLKESNKWDDEAAKREVKRQKDAARNTWKSLMKSILVRKYAASKFDD